MEAVEKRVHSIVKNVFTGALVSIDVTGRIIKETHRYMLICNFPSNGLDSRRKQACIEVRYPLRAEHCKTPYVLVTMDHHPYTTGVAVSTLERKPFLIRFASILSTTMPETFVSECRKVGIPADIKHRLISGHDGEQVRSKRHLPSSFRSRF